MKSIKKKINIKDILWYIFISFICCISTAIIMVCRWSKAVFNVGLNAIINTLRSPLKGTSMDTIMPAIEYCVPFVVLVAVICLLFAVFEKRFYNRIIRIVVTLLSISSFVVAFLYVQTSYDIVGYIISKNTETDFYKDYYVDPREIEITAPAEKRNLIYLYLESMETTYADVENGGKQEVNYMPNLIETAKENISFYNTGNGGGLRPVTGTTWTMGSLFASTSGVPFAFPIDSNGMERVAQVASGIYTLGDFLKDEGYVQEFLCGSDATFAGRKEYLEQHGTYEMFDIYTAREKGYIPEDYFAWWGFEDEILFEIAKDELLRLAEGEEPFNFTFLTVDAHHIGGYTCAKCEDEYSDVTANVISCTDRLVEEFLEWCKQQDFYENTTIVLVGDHPRMDTHLVDGIEYDERTLYNCIINSAHEEEIRTSNREATVMDFFPTTLAALGYEIEGEQLGLGVNLFSEKDTLTEEFGLDVLNQEFSKTSSYYVERFSPELAYLIDDGLEVLCTIQCAEDGYNAKEYITEGISASEGNFSWAEGAQMSFSIPIDKDMDEVQVAIHLLGTNGEQRYTVRQYGEELFSATQEGYGVITFNVSVVNGMCEFELLLPNAWTPEGWLEKGDDREVSLKISYISINNPNGRSKY